MARQKRTPEQVSAARREAARLSHIAQGHNVDHMTPPAPNPPQTPAADGPTDLPGSCPYDLAVSRRKITYNEARLREEVMAKIIENDGLRDDQLIRRGKLFTKEQVEARDSRVADVLLSKLASVEATMVSAADVSKKDQARAAAKDWITEVRTAIGVALREIK